MAAEDEPPDEATAWKVAVWSVVILGWVVIFGLYVVGRITDQKATPPFPSGGATAAASGFWFAFVLCVSSLVGFIRSVLAGLDRIAWVRRLEHFWLLPVIAVALGLIFAWNFWS